MAKKGTNKKQQSTKLEKPNMSSFADLMEALSNEDEVPELENLPLGEHLFELFSLEDREFEKEDKTFRLINIGAKPVDQPNYKAVYDSVWLPDFEDKESDPERFANSMRRFQSFWRALGYENIPSELPNEFDIQGLQFWASVKIRKGNEEYPEDRIAFKKFTRPA
jgi:hypothetical protein